MIIVALDTGMRRGEMLALRFGDIDWKQRLIGLRGETTKSGRTRVVPISTERLLKALEWLRLDSASARKPDSAPVFSNEAGEPVRAFRTAWVLTVLRAYGVKTEWAKSHSHKGLTRECLTKFRELNLHWHDLRHEYASRLVERGVPLAQVRDLLGHASITTTERYDNQRLENLQQAVRCLERGEEFVAQSDLARSKYQDFIKIGAQEVDVDAPNPKDDPEANPLTDEDFGVWLGDRDS